MFSCRTKLCQLLCLKNLGSTTLYSSASVSKRSQTVRYHHHGDARAGHGNADWKFRLGWGDAAEVRITHFANSVGFGQVKTVPSGDQCIKPVPVISSSSSMAYSLPTNAACVLSGGLTNGWPDDRLKFGGLGARLGAEVES